MEATLEGVEAVAPALLKDTKAPAPPEVLEESLFSDSRVTHTEMIISY